MLGEGGADKILTAVAADAQAMLRFAEDAKPSSESVKDYITDVQTRLDLFKEFQRMCHSLNVPLEATLLAIFLVAPVSEIRNVFDMINKQETFYDKSIYLDGTRSQMVKAVKECMCHASHLITLPFMPSCFPLFKEKADYICIYVSAVSSKSYTASC